VHPLESPTNNMVAALHDPIGVAIVPLVHGYLLVILAQSPIS
jgi:hypothetical protein